MSRILYLGLKPPNADVIHCPIIAIRPRPFEQLAEAFTDYAMYTHLVFTSQVAVELFITAHQFFALPNPSKIVAAVGKSTGKALIKAGMKVDFIASIETAEGMFPFFTNWSPSNYVFWPHSALSRKVLVDFWQKEKIKFCECILYETIVNDSTVIPAWDSFDEIVFTSPSTVDAFLIRCGFLPKDKKLTAIGPVTEDYLLKKI